MVDLPVQCVYLLFHGLLVRKQLRIVGLQLDVLVQHLGILVRQQVDGFLKLLEHVHLPGPAGGKPGHDGTDGAAGQEPHEKVSEKSVVHCLLLFDTD